MTGASTLDIFFTSVSTKKFRLKYFSYVFVPNRWFWTVLFRKFDRFESGTDGSSFTESLEEWAMIKAEECKDTYVEGR